MVGANTTSVYPCRHVRANTEKMRDCHLVARTCDNEVGVAISIRDPYPYAIFQSPHATQIFYTAHARRAGHKTWRKRKILHLKRVYGANYMIGERWRL